MVKSVEKYLVLGYFNRGNLGDESYMVAYKHLFPNVQLVFSSIDDTESIPEDISLVLIAGGDIVNPYFIPKIKQTLRNWGGPCYAFSVGIPYEADVKLINIFDHVVVRSCQDKELVASTIGGKNVRYLPDITWILRQIVPPPVYKFPMSKTPKQIMIALAQPAFYNNENEATLIDGMVRFIYEFIQKYPHTKVNLVSYNTHINEEESDHMINTKVYQKLSFYENVINCNQTALRDPTNMLKFVQKQDLVVGMRYHSIVFSMIENIPFVALYCTRKVENLLIDNQQQNYGYKLSHDAKYKPTEIDPKVLLNLVLDRLSNQNVNYRCDLGKFNVLREICEEKITKKILVKSSDKEEHGDIVLENTLKLVKQFFNLNDDIFTKWQNHMMSTQQILDMAKKNSMDLARLISFGITNKISTPYIWGLNDNLLNDKNFNLIDTINWIFDDYINKQSYQKNDMNYYPEIKLTRSVIIDLNYMLQDNYKGLHRSGWSYVFSGLSLLDGNLLERTPQIKVDMCLERTFLWGLNVAKSAGYAPYKTPWVGFIHHTFNTEYSRYNCVELLKIPEFLESLEHCKGLFVLSYYLMYQLKDELKKLGRADVAVFCVTHPTEIVSQTFSLTKFMSNQNRKVIQIGAWLRDPYAIRALPIPPNNSMKIQKAVLKGKEMNNYFCPNDLFEKLYLAFENKTEEYSPKLCRNENQLSRLENTRPIKMTIEEPMTHKYLEGLLKHVIDTEQSVNIIDFIENDDYDDLLSKNIVFLNLVDVSACNTVLECIVRNTPLVVNKHPALIEVLGPEYPGFYTNLYEAATKCIDIDSIQSITNYLSKINKYKFSLEYFMNEFQAKLKQVL
jgi:polysaccharide pyruvyl transferase WcaK-like protein